MESDHASYRPSAFYFRRALREANSKQEAVRIGMILVAELENLKASIRERGIIPEKRFILLSEADEKGWRDGA